MPALILTGRLFPGLDLCVLAGKWIPFSPLFLSLSLSLTPTRSPSHLCSDRLGADKCTDKQGGGLTHSLLARRQPFCRSHVGLEWWEGVLLASSSMSATAGGKRETERERGGKFWVSLSLSLSSLFFPRLWPLPPPYPIGTTTTSCCCCCGPCSSRQPQLDRAAVEAAPAVFASPRSKGIFILGVVDSSIRVVQASAGTVHIT